MTTRSSSKTRRSSAQTARQKREHGGKNISEVLKFLNAMTWNLQTDKRRNKKSRRRRSGRKCNGRKRFKIKTVEDE